MKRKFSLFVTIVVCLLIAAGILSACNEGEKKIASIDFADGEWQTNYYLGEVFEPCVATVTYFYGYSIIDYSVFTYSHFRQII